MHQFRYRREFLVPEGAGERIVWAVEGTAKEVEAATFPPGCATARLRLLNPPDIRVGDHVRHDDRETEPFTAIVTAVGKPYDTGVFNVDVKEPVTGDTARVFCESCEVVFRPHLRPWTGDEILALALDGKDRRKFFLHGATPGRTARMTPAGERAWTVTLVEEDLDVDSVTIESRWGEVLREAAVRANTWLYGKPIEVGDTFYMSINQGMRACIVIAVKKLRYRIEYDMPNAGPMGGWQTGIRIAGRLYRPVDRWHGKAGR